MTDDNHDPQIDIAEAIVILECGECGFRATSPADSMMVATGNITCPDGHGRMDSVARYEKIDAGESSTHLAGDRSEVVKTSPPEKCNDCGEEEIFEDLESGRWMCSGCGKEFDKIRVQKSGEPSKNTSSVSNSNSSGEELQDNTGSTVEIPTAAYETIWKHTEKETENRNVIIDHPEDEQVALHEDTELNELVRRKDVLQEIDRRIQEAKDELKSCNFSDRIYWKDIIQRYEELREAVE